MDNKILVLGVAAVSSMAVLMENVVDDIILVAVSIIMIVVYAAYVGYICM